MSKILHVLNGDATLTGFEQTGLDGDIIVWREVLSEGPVSDNVSAAGFWEARSEFICNTFGETPDGYRDKVMTELEKLSEPYDEINLWFEYDLHCQVNLLGVMMLLEQQTNLSAPAVYLICPVEFAGIDDFKGMGQLNGEQLEYLYDNTRVQLGEYDFKLAAEAWYLFVSRDAVKLKTWLEDNPFWGNMPQLQPAMQAQLNRLPVDGNGLNYIHQKLLAIYNSGAATRQNIYNTFWQTEKIYGMGDAELDSYLQQLNDKGLIKL